jgi:hypothetical protein
MAAVAYSLAFKLHTAADQTEADIRRRMNPKTEVRKSIVWLQVIW